MIDLELSEYALHPASGVAESWYTAGVESAVHEPEHTGLDATPAVPGKDNTPLQPSSIQELDLRMLPAPEPMLRALHAIELLAPGQTLALLTPMLPVPLLEELSRRGLTFQAQRLPDGTARVTVCSSNRTV